MASFRDRAACGWLALMLACAWLMALSRLLFQQRFWDRSYAMQFLAEGNSQEEELLFFGSGVLTRVGLGYFSDSKYWLFAPHVGAAVLWWNGSLLQLVPLLRRRWKGAIHRWNGRIQMAALLTQVFTGLGLSLLSHSPTITLVGTTTGAVFAYLSYFTLLHARRRDFERHRFWATKLLGYSQIIAAQRWFMIVLFALLHLGILYPDLRGNKASTEQVDRVIEAVFDDSFTLAAIVAPLLTEWYQAGQVEDMLRALRDQRTRAKTS